MCTPRKINAILLNIKTNRPKLVSMCRYKLATYWQNFTEIYLTRVKILQKVLGGLLFFDSHCIFSRFLSDHAFNNQNNKMQHIFQQFIAFQ